MSSFIKNSVLTVFSIIIVLIVSELFLRIGAYKVTTFYPLIGLHQFDTDLGWSQIPNHEAVFQGREYKVTVKTNSHGFRDEEYPFKKPVGSKRVVVLGDSFTWGWGVEREEIFCEVAEQNMEGIEFVNLGHPAYGTAQEYLQFQNLGMKFSPDLTILAFSTNDIMDNSGQNPQRPNFILKDGNLVLKNKPVPLSLPEKINHILKDHFLLYSLIDYRIALLKALRKHPVTYDDIDKYFLKSFHEKMRGPWDVTKALLVEINGLANHRLLIMYIPNRVQVEEDSFQQALLESKVDKNAIDLSYPNRLVQEFSERHGIPFLDLTPYFRKESKHVSLYFEWDGHWTKEGHRLAGEMLNERIQKLL